MLPILRLAGDGQEHRFRGSAVETLATEFAITDEERAELLPSGTAPLFDNRVGWARTYLKQAISVFYTPPNGGYFRSPNAAASFFGKQPKEINVELLDQYEEFRHFRSRRRDKSETSDARAISQEPASISDQTPEEAMASAYYKFRKNLEAEVLDQVKAASPAFFERLVIDLLVSDGIRWFPAGCWSRDEPQWVLWNRQMRRGV